MGAQFQALPGPQKLGRCLTLLVLQGSHNGPASQPGVSPSLTSLPASVDPGAKGNLQKIDLYLLSLVLYLFFFFFFFFSLNIFGIFLSFSLWTSS